MKLNKKELLVIGCGYMADEYLKVLKFLGYKAVVVGRGSEKVKILQEKYPDFIFASGGLQNFLKTNHKFPNIAINATNIDFLSTTTEQLLNAGVHKILIEKPGDLNVMGLLKLDELAQRKNAELVIGYNRRFYSSVKELQRQAELDGGILSAHFEFTEWIHTIDPIQYSTDTLNKWIIANSSHLIDTAFYLIGNPKTVNCQVSGKNTISWHPSGSIFSGSGLSKKGIPFSYHSNWLAPGRWSIEILTTKRRFYLKPMETLQIQNIGSVVIEPTIIDDHLDKEFKPGLYLQTKAFADGDYSKFCTIQEQKESIEKFYIKMSGY